MIAIPRRPRVSLRAQLAVLALGLLVLPWVGYRYVKEMERLLREGQEQTLADTARAVATALHNRPQLMRLRGRDDNRLRQQAEDELRALGGGVAAPAPPPTDAPGAPAPEGTTSPDASPAPDHPPAPDGGVVVAPVPVQPEVQVLAPPPPDEALAAPGDIDAILAGLARNEARIWVVNREYRVLSLTGSLQPPPAPRIAADDGVEVVMRGIFQPLLEMLLRPPPREFDEAVPEDLIATGKEIVSALRGEPGTRVRNSADARAVIVSAAHPVWAGDEVVGAVVVEETTNPILSLRNRALTRLLVVTLVVFTLGAGLLLWFATRLSNRIRRLRDEAEQAVDAHGRIAGVVAGSTAGDEVGDLSRSFSAVLGKLAQYHAYLEAMAGRLSHELRTPIAVVRSSLDNLKLHALPDEARVYVERADEGVARLSAILTRMSEAARLEQSLRSAERERYDLARVVAGCVEGYRLACAPRAFDWQAPGAPLWVRGAPDLAAQMLDKLVANAADFATPGTPIHIALDADDDTVTLSVANHGPRLPPELHGRLFDSMVSQRAPATSGAPHLGLGLYIVRLIAEFHGGHAQAEDLESPGGVRMRVTLPRAQ